MIKILAGLSGAFGVAMGAMGSHTLKGKLNEQQLQSFKIATNYQITHAAMTMLAYSMHSPFAAKLFLSGSLLFSGSIYILALNGGPKIFGPVTPIGGLLMMSGWIALAFS